MKVLIIEEHPAILQGLKCNLLQANNFFDITSYSSIHELEIPLDFLTNELVVLGIPNEIPYLFKWIKQIRSYSKIPILVYGVDQSSPVLERLMSMKIQAIVTKQYDFSLFADIVQKAVINSKGTPLQFGFKISRYIDYATNDLSKREVEIINLIAIEQTSTEISNFLNISVSTVENHRKNILRKMNVRNIAGMMIKANNVGYI